VPIVIPAEPPKGKTSTKKSAKKATPVTVKEVLQMDITRHRYAHY